MLSWFRLPPSSSVSSSTPTSSSSAAAANASSTTSTSSLSINNNGRAIDRKSSNSNTKSSYLSSFNQQQQEQSASTPSKPSPTPTTSAAATASPLLQAPLNPVLSTVQADLVVVTAGTVIQSRQHQQQQQQPPSPTFLNGSSSSTSSSPLLSSDSSCQVVSSESVASASSAQQLPVSENPKNNLGVNNASLSTAATTVVHSSSSSLSPHQKPASTTTSTTSTTTTSNSSNLFLDSITQTLAPFLKASSSSTSSSSKRASKAFSQSETTTDAPLASNNNNSVSLRISMALSSSSSNSSSSSVPSPRSSSNNSSFAWPDSPVTLSSPKSFFKSLTKKQSSSSIIEVEPPSAPTQNSIPPPPDRQQSPPVLFVVSAVQPITSSESRTTTAPISPTTQNNTTTTPPSSQNLDHQGEKVAFATTEPSSDNDDGGIAAAMEEAMNNLLPKARTAVSSSTASASVRKQQAVLDTSTTTTTKETTTIVLPSPLPEHDSGVLVLVPGESAGEVIGLIAPEKEQDSILTGEEEVDDDDDGDDDVIAEAIKTVQSEDHHNKDPEILDVVIVELPTAPLILEETVPVTAPQINFTSTVLNTPLPPSPSATLASIPKFSFRPTATPTEKMEKCQALLTSTKSLFFAQPETDFGSQLLTDSIITNASVAESVSALNNPNPATTTTPASTTTFNAVIVSPPQLKSLNIREFKAVTVQCGLSSHLTYALFFKIASTTDANATFTGNLDAYALNWDQLQQFVTSSYAQHFPDMDALAFYILAEDPSLGLVPADLEVIVKDVLDTHPAFDFLNGSDAFQARFTETVITRLFYAVPRVGRGRMSLRDFRTIKLLQMLKDVEAAPSSLGLSMPAAFSYKDFYVIYCKFWELDRDRDMLISPADLEFYGRRALSRAAISRVVECHGCRGESTGFLGFKEFVTFIMSVEDKTSDSGLDYWFRVLDLDEDGVLSLLELETFWEHQQHRLPEHYKIEDFFSLALDLVRPGSSYLTKMDMKRSRASAGLLLDMLLDSRRHIENVRRATDGAFRLRDEVWAELDPPPGEGQAEGEDQQQQSSSVDPKKVRLDGWEKFSERAYRDLANPAPAASSQMVEETADLEGLGLTQIVEDDLIVDSTATWAAQSSAEE